METNDAMEQMLSRLPIPPELRDMIRQAAQKRGPRLPEPQVIPRPANQIIPGMGEREWIIASYGALLAGAAMAARSVRTGEPGDASNDEPGDDTAGPDTPPAQ